MAKKDGPDPESLTMKVHMGAATWLYALLVQEQDGNDWSSSG
jgi:hypothetical protein